MIEVKLFKFDSKTDYLPYYKTYNIKDKDLTTISDLLNVIYSIEKFSYINDGIFFLRANKLFISSDANIADVINSNNELLLEPISIKRAVNDLIIDTKDYKEKLGFLDDYFTQEEKDLIIEEKVYMLDYYASNTLHFNEDYIGEHVLFLAAELIQKKPELKDELSSLVDTENGIRIRTSLQHRVLDINEEVLPSFSEVTLNSDPVQSLENFNVALYCGLNNPAFEKTIQKSNASYVELESKHYDIPYSSSKLSYLMAGDILLEAKDNNADFLVVNDSVELKLFDAKQKNIEKTVGREIDLPVFTREEFVQLLEGNKSFQARKIKIPFLD